MTILSLITILVFGWVLAAEIRDHYRRKRPISQIRCPNCGHWVPPYQLRFGVKPTLLPGGRVTHGGVGCPHCDLT